MAVDTANAYRERTMMQAAADAAVTAGALELPDAATAKAVALDYLEANLPRAVHGETVRPEDVLAGTWDAETGRFVPNAAPLDALAVRVRRSEENGNPLPAFLLDIVGFDAWSIQVQSVARAPRGCESLQAYRKVLMRKEATIGPGVCIYGRDGVELERWSMVESGARIGMRDKADFVPGAESVIAPGVVFEADLLPMRALRVAQAIDDWEAGRRVPSGWSVQIVQDLPPQPAQRTIYIVDGKLRISKSFSLTDAVVAVRGDLDIRKGGSLASATGCASGTPVGVYATGDVSIGKEASLSGADVVAGGSVNADKDVIAVDAIIEAGGDIDLKKDPSFGACRAQRGLFGLESTQIVH